MLRILLPLLLVLPLLPDGELPVEVGDEIYLRNRVGTGFGGKVMAVDEEALRLFVRDANGSLTFPWEDIESIWVNGTRIYPAPRRGDGKVEPPVKDPPEKDPPVKDPPEKDPPIKEPPEKDPPEKDPPMKDPPMKDPPARQAFSLELDDPFVQSFHGYSLAPPLKWELGHKKGITYWDGPEVEGFRHSLNVFAVQGFFEDPETSVLVLSRVNRQLLERPRVLNEQRIVVSGFPGYESIVESEEGVRWTVMVAAVDRLFVLSFYASSETFSRVAPLYRAVLQTFRITIPPSQK